MTPDHHLAHFKGGPLDGSNRVIANDLGTTYRHLHGTDVHVYQRGQWWERTDRVREAIYEYLRCEPATGGRSG